MPIGARLSVMMFLQFFVWGAWYVTVGNYMSRVGMTDAIYWAYTVGPLAGIISPFFLGMVADRFFSTQKVLGTLHLLGSAAMFLAPVFGEGESQNELTFILLLQFHMLCYMPTLGLVNTLSFQNMTNQEKQFPLIRVFGTLGWIAAGIFVSKFRNADTLPEQFHIAAVVGALLGVYSFTLPGTPPPAAGKAVTVRDVLGLEALSLLRNPSFLLFVVSSFLICIPLSAYYAYAPVFVGAAGFEDPGYIMSYGQMSEVFFMLVMPACFARLGVKWMLIVGMFAWVVRYGLFGQAAFEGTSWMILGGILLHGICYDFFFVTGQIYVDKKAPAAIRGQAQGFLVLVTLGLGMLIGAVVAGRTFKHYENPEGKALVAQAAALQAQLGPLTSQIAADLEATRTPPPEVVALAAELRAKIKDTTLPQYNWRMFWFVPCGMAALILLIFALCFKNESNTDPRNTPQSR